MDKASLTALGTAFARAYHSGHVTPKIFDDYLAREWMTPEQLAGAGANASRALPLYEPEAAAAKPDPQTALALLMRAVSVITLSRSRYAEDALIAGLPRLRQYVNVGAGLDTFAFRRRELAGALTVFELDHPATQAMKRERLARTGWAPASNLRLIPVDLARERPGAALRAGGFDPQAPAFFGWLGVTYYLTREALDATLADLGACAPPGSELVFDYLDAEAFLPGRAAPRTQRMLDALKASPEPMISGFDPAGLAAQLARVGWELVEDLSPEDIQARYFQGRTDGYRAHEQVHFARARIRS